MGLGAVADAVVGAFVLMQESVFGYGLVLVACGIVILGSSIVLWWSAGRLRE
jgi:hypothetical protein